MSLNRQHFLRTLGSTLALTPLNLGAKSPMLSHFPPRAKNVIWLFMDGGISHIDTFDYKPRLKELDGKPLPIEKKEDVTGRTTPQIMKSPWEFKPMGKCKKMISEIFPNIGQCSDDICYLHSLHGPSPDHPSASGFIHSGFLPRGFPSIGAWTSYALGTESESLPNFVLMGLNKRQFRTNGFLHPSHQASAFYRNSNTALKDLTYLESKKAQQVQKLETLKKLNQFFYNANAHQTEIESAIENQDKAFQMQTSVPEATDFSGETNKTKQLYGLESKNKETQDFAKYCLSARRLIERGVRFIGITKGGWDQHNQLKMKHAQNAEVVDQPIAGLLKDLNQRGLLDDTLVVFTTEFGRTPNAEGNGSKVGRDHHPWTFTSWMAGGGIKGGITYGQSDDYGYYPKENPVDVHDFHATILHCMGINHEKLTYKYAGRDFRLTDVHGHVLHDILRT